MNTDQSINRNPIMRGVRTGLIILAAIVVVSHFDLFGRTEYHVASMSHSWQNITFQGDKP